MLKSVPSAIRSIPASRRLLQLVDVLISSTRSMASTRKLSDRVEGFLSTLFGYSSAMRFRTENECVKLACKQMFSVRNHRANAISEK